jgi:class 3 adenylate cyclase
VCDDESVTAVPLVPPSGTVTFLFTDVVASTRRWVDDPVGMRAALKTHDEVMRSAIAVHGGYVFSTAGDSFAAAFGSVPDALGSAAEAQLGLHSTPWASDPILVRMGVHVGEADERDGDFFGSEVSRTARVMGVAHGGQVVLRRACLLGRQA